MACDLYQSAISGWCIKKCSKDIKNSTVSFSNNDVKS